MAEVPIFLGRPEKGKEKLSRKKKTKERISGGTPLLGGKNPKICRGPLPKPPGPSVFKGKEGVKKATHEKRISPGE